VTRTPAREAPSIAVAPPPDAAPAPDTAPVDAVLDAADIEMPPVDVARPPVDRPPVEKKQPGLFSIDSTPWATIFIDNQSLGITPIVKRSLPAGRHKLRAVLKDGRTRELTIDIPAGKLAKPIQLTW
jgi:eukaryotic-like serine/threonine-protein kinase